MSSWTTRLANASLSHLPTDFTRPSPPKNVESIVTRGGLDLNHDLLLTSFIVLVSKFTGDLDVSIGTSTSEGLPYVLRINDISSDKSLQSTLDGIVKTKESFEADAAEFDAARSSLSETLYHVRFLPMSKASLSGSSNLDIDLTLFHTSTSITISYNSLLFRSNRIEIFIDQLLQLCSCSLSLTLSELSTVTRCQSAIVPDPTSDLHWSDYQGAIPTIFAENAEAMPDKPCVVVSTSNGQEITYTYDTIHRQSNRLANFLLESGINRGDVVVIYAFRGVDLVVAVMAILKAGATFSVIDPAYPEARQCIYLDVARPRGILMLAKAGVLSSHVRNWIQEHLDPLKVDIANLEISDDGKELSGVPTQSSDSNTGIEIGPDDIPTLSFTSGSEGVPKGVRGRHFSLAYYFPWMVKHFGLSAEDRFTMLSGIAHDPIQRDMFTPLYLGATLVVPTADDIGTPGRLAEWCAAKRVTVTHLTPAMGQLLSSQVAAGVQIPSLRNAFFVGDVLTKRDVKRLQGLARSVDIINMYGTTETQRAVSFFRIPSVNENANFLASCKDIMPAGTGMYDVQLLVVSRDGSRRICGVGEIGEIFVRAGGLAEGYLSLDDVTAQKFVKSWFVPEDKWTTVAYHGPGTWRGVRDRLYRSGDLGRYMPDGNVECSGRADDQVKIRGFRIELGEIDTHLSRHPLVRENITLLRRNKDEEPTLVSYFVPDQKKELDDLLAEHNPTSKQLTVLISGSGTNLQALIDATIFGSLKGKAVISCVISNRKDAYGLQRAEAAGIKTKVWSLAKSRKAFGESRERYDAELARIILEDGKPDLVVCAGFMHILSPVFLAPMTQANVGIINLHPALPGQFTGARAIERAFEASQEGKIDKTGIMIHWVIAEVDMGDPILVREIPINKQDTLEDLQTAIHKEEHKAIVDATVQVVGAMKTDTLVERMQKYQPLVKDIRNYLKGKLATYAVPSVYVPMDKMPLNPNGKVDKPALPYPDTAQQAAVLRTVTGNSAQLNPTQQVMHDIWRDILPGAPASIPLTENFFDLGDHSILATRLIFSIRKAFVLDNVPLGLIFQQPTIGGLSNEIEHLRSGETRVAKDGEANGFSEPEYAEDAKTLCFTSLPKSFSSRAAIGNDECVTVFLTGGTGFLGSFLLRDLLNRRNVKKVIAHVRAKNEESAMTRLVATLEGYGVWRPSWSARLSVVCGDLGAERLGLSKETWTTLQDSVDCVIHNGALVHWVFPYSQLRAPNVIGTVSVLALCSAGRPKTFTFVSSTSVLDTEHYVRESDALLSRGKDGIPESDDLSGSSTGLGTGYGQSKWVSEYICREAGRRGLLGCIVRPGYVVGDSITGVTNTDDFIVRLIKGCLQIKQYPNIHNSVNMVPVDHVARVVVASSFSPPLNQDSQPLSSRRDGTIQVAHVTGHPRLRFIDFLGALKEYGYDCEGVDYIPWKQTLENFIQSPPPSSSIESESDRESVARVGNEGTGNGGADNGGERRVESALFPLLHFVTQDLPGSTKSAELDDSNTQMALLSDQRFTTHSEDDGERSGSSSAGAGGDGFARSVQMGTMLAFLCAVGYLPLPPAQHSLNGGQQQQSLTTTTTKKRKKEVPRIELSADAIAKFEAVGGRGSAAK